VTGLLDRVLNLHGVVIYLVVGLLVFVEDALFVGFVIPGETAAILGGVAASRSNVSIVLICAVVVAAAIVGDTVGYEIGARYGSRLLSTRLVRRHEHRIDAARATLARRGGPAVFIGRFVAFFRAVMPFLAGTSRMHYRRFLAYNAAGGLVWGIGAALLGYLAGNSYEAIEKTFGRVAAIVAAVLVVAALVAWSIRRRRRERAPNPPEAGPTPPEG
jgi:membrane protein DedA with SNARE-associated domain